MTYFKTPDKKLKNKITNSGLLIKREEKNSLGYTLYCFKRSKKLEKKVKAYWITLSRNKV